MQLTNTMDNTEYKKKGGKRPKSEMKDKGYLTLHSSKGTRAREAFAEKIATTPKLVEKDSKKK